MILTSGELYETLTDRDPDVRHEAWETLARYFDRGEVRGFFDVLLRILADGSLSYAWPDCREVIVRVAQTHLAIDDVVRGIVGHPGGALADLLGARPGLSDHEPDLHPWTRAQISLLHSPIGWVRTGAVRELAADAANASVLRVLRRRPGIPARVRSAALRALSEIGWNELTDRDLAVVRRLIEVKQCTERLEEVELEADWYAIPTTDRDAVMDAFDLCDPIPMTMRGGFARFQLFDAAVPMNFSDYELADGEAGAFTCRHVFVTPALDGWTLVVSSHGLFHEDSAQVAARCAELSRRFGTAHFYSRSFASGCGDYSDWFIAEKGAIVGRCLYDHYEHPGENPCTSPTGADNDGPNVERLRQIVDERDHGRARPRPATVSARDSAADLLASIFGEEAVHKSKDDTWAEAQSDPVARWELQVDNVAQRVSTDPGTLGPHTLIEGTGVLAVPQRFRHRRRYGSLPL
jgi:hypothetical protein